MVISNLFLRKSKYVAVAFVVIAVLFLGNTSIVEAKINDAQLEQIKTTLEITNFPFLDKYSEKDLKEVLNKVINKKEPDITYEILILSSWNEMEFMDTVLSQGYKKPAEDYFNRVIDERTNLINYWKGAGGDVYQVISRGEIATNPAFALTLNTFSISTKIVEIFIAFEEIRTVKKYDGLWYYFDFIRNGDSHKVAWEDVKIMMNWAGTEELESQFAALWDKWGPYSTPFGIKEEVKQQVRNELRNTLATALESHKFAEKEAKPGLVENIKQSWGDLISQLQNIENNIKTLAQDVQVNLQTKINQIQSTISNFTVFSPAAVVQTQPAKDETVESLTVRETEERILSESDHLTDFAKPGFAKPGLVEEELVKLTLADLQEELDDILEMVDVINQEVRELSPVQDKDEDALNREDVEVVEETERGFEAEDEEEAEAEETVEETETAFLLCDKTSEPARNKVIFYEIAWMGTENSASNEWMELKNISGTSIDLAGWQILDKDGQIKIVFTGGEQFSANGFLLLERTDDESVPGITADLIYTGALGNTNEALYLFDANCQLQDRVLASPDWPAGENDTKRTMERRPDLSWQSSWAAGGTPGQETGVGFIRAPVDGGGGGSSYTPPPSPPEQEPTITLSYPEENPVNKEIEITFSASNFKNATYDVKISIEDGTTTLSEIFNNKEDNWQNSYNYLKEVFSGTSFGGEFKLKIKEEKEDFRGEADILARVRENGKSSYLEFKNKINITEPEQVQNQFPVASFTFSSQAPFVGELIYFDASFSTDSDGTITDYIWAFGDSNYTSATLATTTHSYATSGDFLVALTVVDDDNATSTATTTINISEKPGAEEIPTLEVVINEIAWMGTGSSSALRADEWIELYNNTTSSIDITGWTLTSEDESPNITFSTSSIPANSYYLIERTDDDTVSDISADWSGSFGTGGLKNEGEKLELKDANGNLIDSVDCSAGWFAGTTTPAYISMERINSTTTGNISSNWANNNLITRNGLDAGGNKVNGTPRAENSVSKSQTEISWTVDYPVLTYLGSPYIVTNNLTVPFGHTLTIEPGVVLKFQQYRGLIVNGTLLAEGEETNKITFAPLVASNYWSSIYFSSSSQDSILDNCLIKNSGQNPDNLAIKVDSTSISLKNSKIENTTVQVLKLINSFSTIDNLTIEKNTTGSAIIISGGAPEIKNSRIIDTYVGIFIEQGSRALIENNYIEGTGYPSGAIYVNNSQPILKNNSGSLNKLNGIHLSGIVSQDWTLEKNEDFPYYLYLTKVTEEAVLEFKPGVTVNNSGILEIEGTLKALGTDADKITISGCSPDNCYKGQFYFAPQSKNSAFKHILIMKGHSAGAIKISTTSVDFQDTEFRNNNIALLLENSSSTVSNSVFSDNPAISIKINGGRPYIEHSTFSNGNVAISIEGSSQAVVENNYIEGTGYPLGAIYVKNSHPVFKNNSGVSNALNGIYLSGTVSNNWTLYKNEIPYVIASLVIIPGKTLAINPGVAIEFYNSNSKLEIEGALTALGQEGNEIIFRALESWWDTIHFVSQEAVSTLEYVIINNGGKSSTAFKGALSVEGAQVEFSNLTFDGNHYSLYFKNASSSSITESNFTNCQRGIFIEGDCPQMTNLNVNCTCNFASPSLSCSATTSSICQ